MFGRIAAVQVDTPATTGAGARWTCTENWSASTTGSSTRNPWARATATAAATARRVISVRRRARVVRSSGIGHDRPLGSRVLRYRWDRVRFPNSPVRSLQHA